MRDGRTRVVKVGIYYDVDQYLDKEWQPLCSIGGNTESYGSAREKAIQCAEAASLEVLGEVKVEIIGE